LDLLWELLGLTSWSSVSNLMQEPKINRQSLPVQITVYKDKSFDFVVKTPPAAVQLMEAAN
jgi:ribosomal protein L11